MDKLKFTRNRTFSITLVFFVLVTVFMVPGVVRLIDDIGRGVPFWGLFRTELTIYAAFQLFFFVLLFFPDGYKTRVTLIFGLVLYAVLVTFFITPKEIGGDLVLLFAAILSQKFGFLRRRTVLKVSGFALLLIGVRIATVITGENELFRAINQIAIAAGAFPLMYWLYETDLQRTRRRIDEIVSDQQQDVAFAEFGRNVAGIIHDLRNYVIVFRSFSTVFHRSDEAQRIVALTEYDRYVKNLNQRIEDIMLITKKRNDADVEVVDVWDTLQAITYIFTVNSAFKGKAQIFTDLPQEPLAIALRVQPFHRLLENVIRNSCEAILGEDRGGEKPEVGSVWIKAGWDNSSLTIKITDDGPGFPFEYDGNILEAPQIADHFTTKSEGGGFGLDNIRRTAELLGVAVDIRSASSTGVTTTITVPYPVILRR